MCTDSLLFQTLPLHRSANHITIYIIIVAVVGNLPGREILGPYNINQTTVIKAIHENKVHGFFSRYGIVDLEETRQPTNYGTEARPIELDPVF